MLAVTEQTTLLQIAARSIRAGLEQGQTYQPELEGLSPALRRSGASFVTLELDGRLRGCIGMLEAVRPLARDVAENAHAAAFRDPRFPPLRDAEYPQLALEISILGPAEALQFASEAELLQQLVPFEDGLILEDHGRRGTFLPTVWESLPRPEQFLAQLKQKAGLPADYWSDSLRVWRYRTQSFSRAVSEITV